MSMTLLALTSSFFFTLFCVKDISGSHVSSQLNQKPSPYKKKMVAQEINKARPFTKRTGAPSGRRESSQSFSMTTGKRCRNHQAMAEGWRLKGLSQCAQGPAGSVVLKLRVWLPCPAS